MKDGKLFSHSKEKKSEAFTQVTVWISERDRRVTKRRCCLRSNVIAGAFRSEATQIRINNHVHEL